MDLKFFLLLALFFISADGSSGQFACNAQDLIFIFDTKTAPRSLDDWRALAGDFVDKFNMRSDGKSIYARFAAIQFGWDTTRPSTGYTSPFPSQDNDSIVFHFDDYSIRSDVKRAIGDHVNDNSAPDTAIGGALVEATNIFTNQLQNNRTPVIILFTNGLAGWTDQSEALSQASILRSYFQVDIWIVLAQDVIYCWDCYAFGLGLTGNKTNQIFNSTGDALQNDAIFSAFSNRYPCTTPTSPPLIEGCPCTVSTSWNDVMILADGSDNMGNDGFTEMWGFIVAALSETTIGQQIAYQTRAGVVVYGNNATLFAPLNKYQSTDQFLSEIWPYKNEQGTNIEAAVLLAENEFKKNGRPKSRKVMIIAASTYREGPYKLPLKDIETFESNQGVVIVIDYGNEDGQSLLQEMASTGFYIDATQGVPDFFVLQKLLCNANCFCPGQGQDGGYYPVSETNEIWPSGGCFWDSTLTSIKTVAERICQTTQAANGTLGQPKTQLQQRTVIQYNTNQSPAKPPFFIALTRQNGNWIWADGSYYDKSVSGEIIDHGGDCAVVQQQNGFNVNITSQGCTTGAYYTCQTKPCTTDFFCE